MFSELFHKKVRADHPPIPRDRSKWPAAWTTPTYKEYPRFEQILLPETPISLGSLEQTLVNRHSTRTFAEKTCPSFAELGTILRYAAGHNTMKEREAGHKGPKNRRFYPSGGGRYPLEVYVAARRDTDSISCGVYHYNQRTHTLEQIPWFLDIGEIDGAMVASFPKKAPLIFIITAVQARNAMKYGDFGYDMLLAEAGHMSQNMHLVAESLGKSYCPFFAFDNENVQQALDIDTNELVLYMTALGNKK